MTPARSIMIFSHARPEETETPLRRIVELAAETRRSAEAGSSESATGPRRRPGWPQPG